ncbi:MAG: cellobiose phosphorylase [Clostridia bacterium]|nr:cellobiose phosphorylase [Clostridia bacterium]
MKTNYYFENGKFIIKNFNDKPPFTDFLPGIAGVKGCPLWAFYVNRGQGIAGFGVSGKELPIMEFFPAEIAYANAPRQGFRTFLRIDGKACEPFRVGGKAPSEMQISRSGFKIKERAGLYEFTAEYFGVPNRNFAALGRIATYTNVTDKEQEVEILDGLAQILPYGISNNSFKETGNLLKSWMTAEGLDKGYSYIKMRSSTADCAEVTGINGGNFFLPAGDYDVIADPVAVFGEDRTKTAATVFNRRGITPAAKKAQRTENELFCSFAHGKRTICAGESLVICEIIGYSAGIELVEKLKKQLTADEVFAMKEEAEREAEKIASKVETHTAFPLFDEYVKQSYFDNVLRGGMPVTVGGKPYYVFSRKHGDPERDYNSFRIEPKPYSCGNGNFRDVAQNRRNDPLITPECGDFNVKYFFSLLQADGYNPLSVLGVRYTCPDVPEKYGDYENFLKGKFTVGDAVTALGLDEKALSELIEICLPVPEAAFAEGYWTDHFVYLIDLVKAYMAVWPDKKDELLYGTQVKWFKSGVRVLPRERQAVKTKEDNIRRLYSIEKVGGDGWQQSGGEDYSTSLAAKLLFLALIKTATLDPLGCGIEMEAGKPGWCDATNGLPALFGSNVADGLELYRLIKIIEELFSGENKDIEMAEEQCGLFYSVCGLLGKKLPPDEFYREVSLHKENYLTRAYAGFNGETDKIKREEALRFLALAKSKLEEGFARAKKLGGGWLPTYLAFEVKEYKELEGGFVLPLSFGARALPHFAEGVAKGLAAGDVRIYDRAKKSLLYDKKLKVFKTSEPLDGETLEIGRIRSFPAGWLERESCFLHMSYKVLLAVLEAGLYEEFYEEIKTGLIPFMPAERYGRSIIENSSFLVTTNHGDKSKWGKGYQARLTGANAETLSMWRVMMGIEQPFTVRGGELAFSLSPKLHRDFFDGGKVSFTLFGKTRITYINRSGKSTWEGTQIALYRLFGEKTLEVKTVEGALAEAVREGKYGKIEVEIV